MPAGTTGRCASVAAMKAPRRKGNKPDSRVKVPSGKTTSSRRVRAASVTVRVSATLPLGSQRSTKRTPNRLSSFAYIGVRTIPAACRASARSGNKSVPRWPLPGMEMMDIPSASSRRGRTIWPSPPGPQQRVLSQAKVLPELKERLPPVTLRHRRRGHDLSRCRSAELLHGRDLRQSRPRRFRCSSDALCLLIPTSNKIALNRTRHIDVHQTATGRLAQLAEGKAAISMASSPIPGACCAPQPCRVSPRRRGRSCSARAPAFMP